MQPEVERQNEKIERVQGEKEISDRKAKKPHERRNGWGHVHETNHAYGGKERMKSSIKVEERNEYFGSHPVLHL